MQRTAGLLINLIFAVSTHFLPRRSRGGPLKVVFHKPSTDALLGVISAPSELLEVTNQLIKQTPMLRRLVSKNAACCQGSGSRQRCHIMVLNVLCYVFLDSSGAALLSHLPQRSSEKL